MLNKGRIAITVILPLIFFASTGVRGESWTIGIRTLPAPAAASDSLGASIAATPQPDPAMYAKQTTFTTTEEWLSFIRVQNAKNLERSDALAEKLPVTIEKDEIAGVTVRMVTPAEIDPGNRNRIFVYVHDGAYVLNGGKAGLFEAILIAHHAKIHVVTIDYRMPPEHPFPAAIDDVVAVWKSLLRDRSAGAMALGGTSAGGGLTLASVHRLKQLGLDLPGALWAGTPWADLTKTGDSLFTNDGIDRVLVTYEGALKGAAKLYADGRDIKIPLISPVYGDFTGFPPTYLVTGTRDLFLSDTVRVHRKMRIAGVLADLNVYEGVSHADYMIADLPESEQIFGELAAFLRQHLE